MAHQRTSKHSATVEMTSAANLKFLPRRQTRLGTSNSKAALGINRLLVHL